MSEFTRPDGTCLYWAAMMDSWNDEAFDMVYTYAHDSTSALAQLQTTYPYEEIEDVTRMDESHLSQGRVVVGCALWAVETNNTALLKIMLDAYTNAGQYPHFELLIKSAEKGLMDCFIVLRPHFSIAFMGEDKLTPLARAVGRGGSLDLFEMLKRSFSPHCMEHILESASLENHSSLIATVAPLCAVDNVITKMRVEHDESAREPLERWLREQQRLTLMNHISDGSTITPLLRGVIRKI